MYSVARLVYRTTLDWSSPFSVATIQLLLGCMIISLATARVSVNDATIDVRCNDTGMHLYFTFPEDFKGAIYTKGQYWNSRCSFVASPLLNSTQWNAYFPFHECHMDFQPSNNGTAINATVVIRQHNLFESEYDTEKPVACEILGRQITGENATLSQRPTFDTLIEMFLGYSIFGEVGNPTESSLYFVVSVNSSHKYKDMLVRNCIAHDADLLNNETALYVLSDFYGCPNPSSVLTNFTVLNVPGDYDLMAYAPFGRDMTMFIRQKLYFSCGVTVCTTKCSARCRETRVDTEALLPNTLSKVVTRNYANRLPGSVIPSTLTLDRLTRRIGSMDDLVLLNENWLKQFENHNVEPFTVSVTSKIAVNEKESEICCVDQIKDSCTIRSSSNYQPADSEDISMDSKFTTST